MSDHSTPQITEVLIRLRLSTGREATYTYAASPSRFVLDGVQFDSGKLTADEAEELLDVARSSFGVHYPWSRFMPPAPVVEEDEPEEHERPRPEFVAEAAQ